MKATGTKAKRILLAALLLPLIAQAQEPIGRVLTTKGQVSARDANGTVRSLTRRAELFELDTLLTAADSFLVVRFIDDAQLSLSRSSELKIERYRFDGNPATPDAALLTLTQGCIRTVSGQISGPPDEHRIDTPVAAIRMRGTFHEAAYDAGVLYTSTLEGGTTVVNAQGSLDLGIGGAYEYSQTLSGAAPEGVLARPAQFEGARCSNVQSTPSASQPNGSQLPQDLDFSTNYVNPSAAPSSPAAVRPGP